MTESVLIVEKSEGIATLTLNRPKARNALSRELRGLLRQAFAEINADPEVEVVILTGSGKAFCAGLDLKELAAGNVEFDASKPIPSGDDFFFAEDKFDRPLIGAINGAAITGGFELALMCDILIASTGALFADTHVRVGIMPGAGISQKLSRILGIYRAKELSLTGNFLPAKQAEAWGLVNRVVEPDELLPTCRALAKDIMSCPKDIVRKYKRLIDRGYGLSYSDGLKLEAEVFNEHIHELARGLAGGLDEARRKEVQQRGRDQKKEGMEN